MESGAKEYTGRFAVPRVCRGEMGMCDEVTVLLRRWSEGDEQAGEALFPLVFQELRKIARARMRDERPGHTLQATALVGEAYLRLVDQSRVRWRNRAHFFGISARLMRRILVDHARRRASSKRGGDWRRVTLTATPDDAAAPIDVLALDLALERLEALDPDMAQVVELRFFGGMTIAEAAEVMGISRNVVKQEWAAARLWLARELHGRSSDAADLD